MHTDRPVSKRLNRLCVVGIRLSIVVVINILTYVSTQLICHGRSAVSPVVEAALLFVLLVYTELTTWPST